MKNVRPLLVILISIIVGAAAVALAAKWVSNRGKVSTTSVVVAAQDIEVGTRLTSKMLQVVEWPATAPLKDAFSSTDKLADRVVNTQVLRGEPVLAAKLAPPGEKGGLSAVLEDGKRAVTVKVNEIVGVAGFALPGNYVDVMVNTPDEANNAVSKIVLERILVLAVAQDTSTGADAKPRVVNAVTLEVTPEEAEMIDLARSVGSLSLVLRSQVDKGRVATSGARKEDLLGKPTVAPVTTVAAPTASSASAAAQTPPRPAPRRVSAPVRKPASAPAPSPAAERVEVIRGLQKSGE
ncbi:MAG TPA: Flp pilus assembly protein CpaB [Aquabacterium sp.]|uniref:Flp pilus assembly protein CpaB n=1 Tax=Aquabacterium sp. TaxID=1872578 RepID=UPI002E3553E7|nr:Flp pilus assembly protein CpaB [Aquabacterium sp.]HEX5372298.1 Flp pilus assembly protein CpaB [Aquabacterium sp.]